MIRIRYNDFSAGTHDVAGLHGRVERGARGITVCLLPGLTAWQRKAVIRRLRQEASRGFGPALPVPQLAIALGLDRVQTAARVVRSIVRLHPAVTLVPGVFVVAMAALFVVAAGDRSGIAPGARAGLADAAVSGSVARAALSAGPSPLRVMRVAAAWYVCPPSATAARSRSQSPQLACRRAAPRAVPHTAHLPGPLDFAW